MHILLLPHGYIYKAEFTTLLFQSLRLLFSCAVCIDKISKFLSRILGQDSPWLGLLSLPVHLLLST